MKAGWTEANFGDVVTLHYGKALAKEERSSDASIPVYGANGIMDRSNRQLADGPSLIIGRKGSAGEINRVDGPFWPSDVTYFTSHDQRRLDFDFLHYSLQMQNLPNMARGVKPGINRNDVYELSMPLPPLEEQRRIVAILDEAFEGLDRTRANAEANLASARELFESLLNSVVIGKLHKTSAISSGGSITELALEQARRKADRKFRGPRFVAAKSAPQLPMGWVWSSPEQLCTHIVDCLHATPKWTQSGEICLRTTNFRVGELDLSEVRYVSSATYETRISRLEPEPADVLYSREGGILGIACMFPDGLKACLGQRMMQFRVRENLILPEFLCAVLNSSLVLGEVRHFTGGAAAPHLNIGDIRQFPIPVPPLDEQQEMVDLIRDQRAQRRQLLHTGSEKRQRLDDLRQSLLQKAFAGELT